MKLARRSLIALFFLLNLISLPFIELPTNCYAVTQSTNDTKPQPEEKILTTPSEQISITTLQELAKKDPKAAYDLSLRYFRGDGIPQDSYQALLTMRDAAERGLLEAQKALGRLYLTGLEEMGSDLNEAHKWLSIAAGRGDKEAVDLLEKVTSASKSDREWYNYRQQLHPFTYRYWYHDFHYKLYWRHGRWRYY
jgi:TPR repeat protein